MLKSTGRITVSTTAPHANGDRSVILCCHPGYNLYVLLLLLLLLSRFSRVRLCDPIDGSPSGSPVPGILQARTLEWVAISFSNAWKWKVKGKSLSCGRLFVTPWTVAHQAPPPSMGLSRQEYWSGVPLPSPCTSVTDANFKGLNNSKKIQTNINTIIFQLGVYTSGVYSIH